MEDMDPATFIRNQFEQHSELSNEDLVNIYHRVQSGSISHAAVMDLVMELVNLATKDINEFANKSKKDIMDLLSNIIMTKSAFTLALNEENKKIIDKLSSILMKEQEWIAVCINKIIQVFIEAEAKQNDKTTDGKYFLNFFHVFYDALSRKIDSLKNINSYIPHLSQLGVATDTRGVKVKSAPMEYSMSYFADIIAHIIMIIEASFLNNEQLFVKIKDLLLDLIVGFERVQLDALKGSIPDEYYNDLIYAMNKLLTFIAKMMGYKVADSQHRASGRNAAQQENFDRIAKFIFERTKRGKELIKIVLHILKHSSIEKPKQIHDCYINICMYASICPDLLLEHFEEFFGNNIFKTPTLTWSPHDFVNVYLNYNSALRILLFNKGSSDGGQQQISKLNFSQLSTLVDNLVYIIFDNRTFPNFYLRALEDLKQLLDYIKKDVDTQGPLSKELIVGATTSDRYPRYTPFLNKILTKLTVQLKIARDNVEEFVEYITSPEFKHTSDKGSKLIDEVIFKDMPRYEENPDPEKMHAKIMQFISRTEPLLNDDSTFFYHNHHKTVVSSLMEDKEGFMMNSYPVNNNKKININNFIEEYLFKRVALLNEITMLLFMELANLSFDKRTHSKRNADEQGVSVAGQNRPSCYYQNYAESEMKILKKMYKYNLQIFNTFSHDPQHMKEFADNFKFSSQPFERQDKDGDLIRIDQRQLYMLYEDSLPIIFLTLKKLYRCVDIYPHLYHLFFDCFAGTDFQQQPAQHERPTAGQGASQGAQPNPSGQDRQNQNGLYMINLLSELFIRYIMIMFSKLPEKLDTFHFLYDKDINIHFFFIKVLKFIYRMVKMKMDINKPFGMEMIAHLKKHTFKLVMVILKLSIISYYPMDYLALLRIIFLAVSKSEHFTKYFNSEMREKKIRILDYYVQMYNSGIDELKVMATELVLSTPIELKQFMSRYPEHAADIISMITFALTLQQNLTILTANRALDHIISSSSLLSEEIIKLIGSSTEGLFRNLSELLTYFKDKSYFLKSSSTLEPSIIMISLKNLARIAPFIRNLNIPISFKVTDEYVLNIEKTLHKTKSLTEESETNSKDAQSRPQTKSPFDWVDPALLDFEIEENGKIFKINSVQTLLGIFITLDVLKTKSTIYSYSNIASNLLFIPGLKHQIGLEKFMKYLNKIMIGLIFTPNDDIELFFQTFSQQKTTNGTAMIDELKTQGLSHKILSNLPESWRNGFEAMKQKPNSEKFLLERVIESYLTTMSFSINLIGKDAVDSMCQGTKEIFYSMAYKMVDEKVCTTWLQHNFLCLFQSVHTCIQHHIVMQRDSTPLPQFKLIFQLVDNSLRYIGQKQPHLAKALQEMSFRMLLEMLSSADKTQAVGALIFFSNMFQAKRSMDLFAEYTIEIMNGLFGLMNRLSCKFYLSVQKKAQELSKGILLHFKETRKPEDKIPGIKKLTEFFVRLIPSNKHYEQRVLMNLMNTLIEGIPRAQFCEIMFGEVKNPEEKVLINDILLGEKYIESACPLYLILDYIFTVMRSYRSLIQHRNQASKNQNMNLGGFKELSYDDCSALTSAILVAYYLFKWRLPFKNFDENQNFDPQIQEIIETLLELIKENEDFNEKKMEGRGSSVKPEKKNREQSVPTSQGLQEESTQPEAERQVGYRANQDIYFQNFEYRIFVDDYDFQIQAWSTLIDTVVNFLFTFMMKPEIYDFIKQRVSSNPEKPKDWSVYKLRIAILEKMFDLFSRVESRIREAAERGFKTLLKAEQYEKDIMPAEKMEQCFKPLLAVMQNPDPNERRYYLNENSMYCFKKIFMLFKSWFNLQKVFERISDYLRASEEALSTENVPPKEEDISQINSIFSMITLIIRSLMITVGAEEEYNKIMPRGLTVEKFLQDKNVYYYSVKPKLEKLINLQSSSTITKFTKQKLSDDQYFNFIINSLKRKPNHSLRERASREDAIEYLDTIKKDLDRRSINEEEYNLRLSRWSQIVYVLLKRLPGFMASKTALMMKYFDFLKYYLDKPELLEEKPWTAKSATSNIGASQYIGATAACEQFVLTLKILVAFVSHNTQTLTKEKLEIIFSLVDLGDLKICYYLNFIKLFFKNTIPKTFSDEAKKDLMMHYFSFYGRDPSIRWSKVPYHSNEHYLKQVNYVMNLPILSHIFENKIVESSFLFHPDIIDKIKKIIHITNKSPTEPGSSGNSSGAPPEQPTSSTQNNIVGPTNLPTYQLIDLTVLFDYILCKVDISKLRFDQMKISEHQFNDFLKDLLLFSWKNIVRVQNSSKLLINLSKLVVSRIKSRSTIMNDTIGSIYELFTNVLNHAEDIVDEDNKNIWLNICDVLLPEIQQNNDKFEANVQKKPSFWFEQFLKAKELEDVRRVSNNEVHNNASRWWIVLFRNRALARPQRHLLLENVKFFTSMGPQLYSTRAPYILLDVLLVFITWYVQDYKQCILEGKSTEGIYGLNQQKEEYLFRIIIELIKKDDDGVGCGFLNRAYFLFRFFYLFLGKSKIDYESYKHLLDHWRKKNQSPIRDEIPGMIRKRLRVNFVLLNISIAVLYHPKIKENKEKEAELLRTIYDYVMKELQHKYSKDYVKYPYLTPLGYHIILKILRLCDDHKRSEYFEDIRNKASESIKMLINDRELRQPENQEGLSLWVAILLYRIIYEIDYEVLREQLESLQKLAGMFCDQITNKKAPKDAVITESGVYFNENEDILDRLFVCHNTDLNDGRANPRPYYKGYNILILRILMKFVDHKTVASLETPEDQPPQIQQQNSLIVVCNDLLKNSSSADYDIKIEVLMLMRCLIVPQTVKSPVYKGLAKDKDFLTLNQKINLIICLDLDQFIRSKELKKPSTKLFVDYLWKFLMDFIELHPSSRVITKFIRKIALNDAFMLSLSQRDAILNKINELGQDYHFSKFFVIANHEYTANGADLKGDQDKNSSIDNIKKFNLLTGAFFSKHGVVKSKLCDLKTTILDTLFKKENDSMNQELDARDLVKRDTENIYFKAPDVYKPDEIEDIDEFFYRHVLSMRYRIDSELDPQKYFKSYRSIIDMENFCEIRNTYVFWQDYIKQLWEQSNPQDKEKLWLALNDLLTYVSKLAFYLDNSDNDTIFLLKILRELSFPPMLPEQVKFLSKKTSKYYPLAGVNFLETYLDKNLIREHSLSSDCVYACFEDALEDLKEKDLVWGFRKTYLEKERDKNLLTMLQLRDYQAAEELCEEIVQDADICLPSSETLKGYIEKHIIEEASIEIKKAFNEWTNLYELSKETERRDLLLEASYFTQQWDVLEKEVRQNFDEDSPMNLTYYMTSMLVNQRPEIIDPDKVEAIDQKIAKAYKESIYLMLIRDWVSLPRVFSEGHIHQAWLVHFWVDFDDMLEIIQEMRSRKPGDQRNSNYIVKFREDISLMSLICRQRIPNPAEGIINAKKLLEQRSILSSLQQARMKQLMDGSSMHENDNAKYNIFSETIHNAVVYAKTERSFGIYSSIIAFAPELNRMLDEKLFCSQADEYLYYEELVKFWQVDEDNKDPPERVLTKLRSEHFSKELRSGLHNSIMQGYMDRGNFEKTNDHGLEGLRLNEENWKLWVTWFHFYKRLYAATLNTDKGLVNLREMIKSYVKAIKYKPQKNILLFTEILNALYFREDAVKTKYDSDDSLKAEIVKAFASIFTETPVWTWTIWIGNLLINVYKKSNLKLDEIILREIVNAAQQYRAFTNYILGGCEKEDQELKDIYSKTRSSPQFNMKVQEYNLSKLTSIFESEKLVDKRNDISEALCNQYSNPAMLESRNISILNAKCKDLGDLSNQFKNQDQSQKFIGLLKIMNDFLNREKINVNKKPESSYNSLAFGCRFGLVTHSHMYTEKALVDFFTEAYLLPDIKVVYEARRFGLQLEFLTFKSKKYVYTLKKSSISNSQLMSYNHYIKLMNIEMYKNNETVYRSLRFEPIELMYLEEEYCLKAKPHSEVQLIDILDEEMEALGEIPDHSLELFALKKNVSEVNKAMVDLMPNNILKREIIKRLKNEFDFFLWKKRYAQSLGVNMINSLLFVKEHNFEKLRIIVSSAEYYDDNINFKIDLSQKNKNLSKTSLRLTQNNRYLLNEYMIEGALIPSIGAVGGALSTSTGELNIATLMSLFLKDFYAHSSEDRGQVYKSIEPNIESYYLALLRMTGNYEIGNSKNTRNPAFTSLRAFIDNCTYEDNLKSQPLSFRSWF